ncbi:methionine sulfoxide reductase [Rhodobacterales bacterium 59_46_T64]|nr:methionine sulfoxide reductase [Rhodobacterales bacterium 59_46_T64]
MSTKGRSLQLFFIDGRPDGMLTAEVFNWTGHVLRSPRTQLRETLTRREAQHTGVYVLIGEKDGAPMAYIGEAEELAARLRDHAAKKDWWETAVLITSAADNLHKAHVKYLESRLVEIAKKVNASALENANIPPRSSLTEADRANMESYLDTLQMVLPAIRVDLFLDKTRPEKPPAHASESDFPTFTLISVRHGVNAIAILKDGEMIVQAGSQARASWVGDTTDKTHYHKLHAELIENGVLVSNGTGLVFSKDYAFSSPSAAGAIATGRSSNGRRDWKLMGTQKTYAEWEDDTLGETEALQ